MATYIIKEIEGGVEMIDPVITVDPEIYNINTLTGIIQSKAYFTLPNGSVTDSIIKGVELNTINAATLLVKTKQRIDELYKQ